jgi:hypothetical protein
VQAVHVQELQLLIDIGRPEMPRLAGAFFVAMPVTTAELIPPSRNIQLLQGVEGYSPSKPSKE